MDMKHRFQGVTLAAAVLMALGGLTFSPAKALASAECKIKCETCTVKVGSGEAECKNCEIIGCGVIMT